MKGGKEKDRIIGPLFPRLHVNDTDKGGPRAPPRNKMALYEQLSIPSQRFNSTASALPRPPPNTSTLVPTASSNQGCGHERSVHSPYYVPAHTPVHSSERVNSRSFDGMNLNATRMETDQRSIKHMSHRTLNATRSVAECGSLHQHDSNAKNSSEKKLEDEDDFRVPTFVQAGIGTYSDRDAPVMEPEKIAPISKSPQKNTSTTFISSLQCPNVNEKPSERVNTSDMKSINFNRNHGEKKCKETLVTKELKERSVPLQELVEKFGEPSNIANVPLDRDHTSTINVFEKSHHGSTIFCQESCGGGVIGGTKNLNDINSVENRDASRATNESMSKPSLENSLRTSSAADKCGEEGCDEDNGTLEMGDVEKNSEVSEASMVDFVSGLEISPDDVVGVIGPKHFWKARRAIVNQQRVFAVQVFELHRLIKVQKLIAASPHLLLEGNPYSNKSSAKVPSKNPQAEGSTKSQPQTVKHKDGSQKPNQNAESPPENTAGAPPLPSHEDGVNQGPHDQVPRNGLYSGTPPSMSMAPENKPSPLCFHLPANQWLVPVMSPSEGLVYKPYTGPGPPAGGFMAPVYGSCSPLSLPPVAGDFMNPTYGVPASHQPQNFGVAISGAPAISPNYFPAPYGLPVVNTIISSSAVEQVSPLPGSRPNGQIDQHSRSSYNMSHPKREAFSGLFWKFQASKDSELQGSTASSPCEKAQESDALPLFPMAPATGGTTGASQSSVRDNQTRVIKVVPHNARSATESAARIFRSIQEERTT